MNDVRASIVTAARACIGTPWKHQGRLPGVGLDCIGLVVCVARDLQLVPPHFDYAGAAYKRVPKGQTLIEECEEHMARIRADDIQPGDVGGFHFGEDPQHLAIFGDYVHGGLSMIHASHGHGRVVEHHFADTFRRRLVAAYRMPGVPA